MVGVFSLFGSLGKLIFTFVGGQMFDHISRDSPFVFQACMDMMIVLISLTMTCMGKLKSNT